MQKIRVSDAEAKRQSERSALGALLFLVSLGVAFAAIFSLYGALRSGMPAWPPPGLPRPPLLIPTLNTVVVLASSVAYHGALTALRQGKQGRFRVLLLVTTNLGTLFLLLQLVLGRQAISMGIVVGQSLYAGLLFSLAAFHAVHLLVGVVAVGALAAMARQGRFGASSSVEVRLWGYYWHFVGGGWLVMYVLLFLM